MKINYISRKRAANSMTTNMLIIILAEDCLEYERAVTYWINGLQVKLLEFLSNYVDLYMADGEHTGFNQFRIFSGFIVFYLCNKRAIRADIFIVKYGYV